MSDASLALQATNVSGGYGRTQVLHDVSFALAAGGKLAVLGRNGVGKSTLLKHLVGELKPSGGSIEYHGTSVVGARPSKIAHLGMAYVPQEEGVFAGLTVRENLLIGAIRNQKASSAQLDEAFHLFPKLRDRQKQLAGTMSGGERKAVAIARALLTRPRVLLLDEPSEGVWGGVVEEIATALNDFATRGTLVLVEQHLDFALAVADQVIVMDRGRVVLAKTRAELASRTEIEDLLTF